MASGNKAGRGRRQDSINISRSKYKRELKRELNSKQMKDIQRVFKMYDRNGDETINIRELRSIMQLLHNNPTKKDIEAIMKEADRNGSGQLEFDEFALLMAKHLKEPEEEQLDLLESFRVFDKDNSGTLDKGEIKAILRSVGEKLSDEQLDEIIQRGDTNQDGVLDYNEFAKLLCPCPSSSEQTPAEPSVQSKK